jgi:diguanylate cyclase
MLTNWPTSAINSAAQEMTHKQLDLEKQLAERDAELERLRQEFRQMKEQASKDFLTNLANRFAFFDAMQSAIAQARTDMQSLSLMMIDIDHFKVINDRHGHLIGDMALQSFSKVLLSRMNMTATAARYGGEEFAVILPNTDLSEALKLTDALREDLTNLKLHIKDGNAPDIRLTVSIGIAQFRLTDDVRHLIDRADSGLYAAKREGRNCVRMSAIS